jgi:hypothetical protein
MANRNFQRMQSLTREVKVLHAKITIGASGAPTLVSDSSVGVASISRTSEGLYVLTLDDKYSSLLNVHSSWEDTTPEPTRFQINSESVASAKTITFNTYEPTAADDTAMVVGDPVSGAILRLTIELKNTSVAR